MPRRPAAARDDQRARATSVAATPTRGEPSHETPRSKPPPGLAVVATPIGNAEDITLRALAALAAADVIACEDTRVTQKLLALHGIARPLVPYHDHNAERMRPKLLERLRQGERVALVADAGTPLISDPGYKLVRAAIAEGLAVTALPGPAAPITALVVSGLPTDRFLFAGFLPAKAAARRRALAELATVPASLIFFESAPRLAAALADMAAVLGPRPAAVARELTKLFEEVRRGDLAALAERYAAEDPPRGELVLVVGPPAAAPTLAEDALDAALQAALAEMSLKDAASAVAAASGRTRREVYQRALKLAGRAR